MQERTLIISMKLPLAFIKRREKQTQFKMQISLNRVEIMSNHQVHGTNFKKSWSKMLQINMVGCPRKYNLKNSKSQGSTNCSWIIIHQLLWENIMKIGIWHHLLKDLTKNKTIHLLEASPQRSQERRTFLSKKQPKNRKIESD